MPTFAYYIYIISKYKVLWKNNPIFCDDFKWCCAYISNCMQQWMLLLICCSILDCIYRQSYPAWGCHPLTSHSRSFGGKQLRDSNDQSRNRDPESIAVHSVVKPQITSSYFLRVFSSSLLLRITRSPDQSESRTIDNTSMCLFLHQGILPIITFN